MGIEDKEKRTENIYIFKEDGVLNDNSVNISSKNLINSNTDKDKKEDNIKDNLENKDDDEIIDLTKVKEKILSVFSKIKSDIKSEEKDSIKFISSETQNIDNNSGNEDDEINFTDITKKIKSSFSTLKHNLKSPSSKHKNHSKSSHVSLNTTQGDDNFDFSLFPIISFFKKNKKWIIPVCLILITIFVSSYFRMMPSYLPITDVWAENTVNNYYQNQIIGQVNQQYPNLPEQNRNALVDKEFQNFLKENKEMLNQQIAATSQQYKAQLQDDSGQTYLLAIDPYLWFGEARNYINNGHFGTEVVDGKEINFLRNGREGRPGEPGSAFHLYFEVFLYKFFHFFNKNVSLIGIVFLVPVIIIGLSLIPAFLIGRKIAGNVGGFFAGIIIATNAALLSRTPAGFSDTDPYNIFFPILILWLFLESFDAKNLKNKLIYGSLSGFCVGLYSAAWGGWWYAFGFALATLAIYFCYEIVINYKKLKKNILSLPQLKKIFLVGIAFFFSSGIFVSLFSSFNNFMSSLFGPLHVITLKEVGITSIWPNVLTTVAEFNIIPLKTIISQMGGNVLFFISILGIILTTLKKDSEGNRNVKYFIFLTIWFIGTAYGFTKGIRFGILMVPAFGIAFGAGVGIIYQYASKWLSKNIGINQRLTKIIIIALICLLFISPITATNNTAKNEIPSMNDAWYNSLIKIRDNSTDALITSWWDFGHWFVAISERRVTFDGADQGERIHWVGKTLLTPDEQVSVGLLRMLNCGQEKAVHVIEEILQGDTVKAVDILNNMMILNDKQKAIKFLSGEGFSSEEIVKILPVTYCEYLIDQFFITSEDMVGKAGVWGHFGSWDFKRASMFSQISGKSVNNAISILTEDFDLTETEADKIYSEIQTTDADQWISPWPGYQGNTGCNPVGNTLECSLNLGQGSTILIIDLNTMNVSIPLNNADFYPNSFVYATKEGIEEKEYTGNLIGLSVVLIPESNQIILTHPLQANSMFTKLFFLNGHGLECFTKFNEVTSFNGQKIITWKVDFTCQQNNQVYFLPKEKFHAAHILISTQDKNEEEALILINSIRVNLTTDNFAQYAQEYSQDQGSAINGGDLGWFEKGQMVQEFDEATLALEKGKISEPVKTEFGYHLIYLIEKK